MGKAVDGERKWVVESSEQFWAYILGAEYNPFIPLSLKWAVYGMLYGRCFFRRQLFKYFMDWGIPPGILTCFRDYPWTFCMRDIDKALNRIQASGVPFYKVGHGRLLYKGKRGKSGYRITTYYHIPKVDAPYVPERIQSVGYTRDRKSRTVKRSLPGRQWMAGMCYVRVGKEGEPNRLVWRRLKGVRSERNPRLKYRSDMEYQKSR